MQFAFMKGLYSVHEFGHSTPVFFAGYYLAKASRHTGTASEL